MKCRTVLFAALLSIAGGRAGLSVAAEPISLIPMPVKFEQLEGTCALDSATQIIYSGDNARREAETLADSLRPATGFPFSVQPMPALGGKLGNAIVLAIDENLLATLGPEGYRLEVLATPIIRITAPAPAGLFYGGQTLRQLLPAEIFTKTRQTGVAWNLPACRVEDQPRFAWRGLMLDCSRHFITADAVKEWIDWLALHKLNVLHWHLDDDEGWRFESKKHPLLTQVGAWREQPPIGRYGGYYTQDEMRAVVAYAAKRHVTIVPEIEMPSHSRAAIAAYPILACGGGKTVTNYFADFPPDPTRPHDDQFPTVPGSNVFCAGKEATYKLLEDVLTEVMDIFPGTYIHVGGDEVEMDAWNHCADCRALMQAAHLANGQQLQAYFMSRAEKIINARGRKMIGWDEIMEGGLSPTATVMSWRGTVGGTKAARSGHDAVMTPGKPLYFDHGQSDSPLQPHHWPAKETLEEVYNYDPVPKGLSPAEARHILGAQANLWREYLNTDQLVQNQVFPRICALAEITWGPPNPKDYHQFLNRLEKHFHRLDLLGITYWHEPATIGGWNPDPKFKDWTPIEIALTGKLTSPGPWRFAFNYQKGADALETRGIELLANGRRIGIDSHDGRAGAKSADNVYAIDVEPFKPDEKLSLKVIARGLHGKTDSAGLIQMAPPCKTCATICPTPGLRSTTPVAGNSDRAAYDWQARHQQALEYLRTHKPEIVLLGDSIAQDFGGEPAPPAAARAPDAWRRAFGAREVANLGCGSDRTENVLWRIEHGELDGIAPRQVLLCAGIENLAAGDSASETEAGIETLCLRIHEKLPAARLLVVGLLPCRRPQLAADVDRVNFQLETRLQPQSWVRVLDLGNKYRNADGSINETLFSDEWHPNQEGYTLLAGNLKLIFDRALPPRPNGQETKK